MLGVSGLFQAVLEFLSESESALAGMSSTPLSVLGRQGRAMGGLEYAGKGHKVCVPMWHTCLRPMVHAEPPGLSDRWAGRGADVHPARRRRRGRGGRLPRHHAG